MWLLLLLLTLMWLLLLLLTLTADGAVVHVEKTAAFACPEPSRMRCPVERRFNRWADALTQYHYSDR